MSTLPSRFGSELAGEYFSDRELNGNHGSLFGSVDSLWETLTVEQDEDSTARGGRSPMRTILGNESLHFRGQSNHGHGLSSSLHRFVRSESAEELSEKTLGDVEQAILAEAERHGLKKNVSPGELLMILQHHSAPTRLLDVSVKPLEALYFAVESNDSIDGRLFFIWLREPKGLVLSGIDHLPWANHVRSATTSASGWTQSLRVVEEQSLDPRMIAQRGRFLVGGLNRAYANLNMWHERRQLRIAERTAISMFCIDFPKTDFDDMQSRRTAWPALGWTVRIPAKWKLEIRQKLRSVGITHESMYPDLSSIQWRAEVAGRSHLGT